MAEHAQERLTDSPNVAYSRGVLDVLRWLTGDAPTDMLREVTR